jgi:hypothetical protein
MRYSVIQLHDFTKFVILLPAACANENTVGLILVV